MTTCLSNGLRVRTPRTPHDAGSVLLLRAPQIYECVEYAQAVRRRFIDADWEARLPLVSDDGLLLERLRAANTLAAVPLAASDEKRWMHGCVATQGAIMHIASAKKNTIRLLSSIEKEPSAQRGGVVILRVHFELPCEPCYGLACVDYVTARLTFESVDATAD